jgi:hypothetical protein
MSIYIGSLTATHSNYLGVRSVPFAASHDTIFSASFRGIRRSELLWRKSGNKMFILSIPLLRLPGGDAG